MLYTILLLFLQNTADIANFEREMNRGNSVDSNPSIFEALTNPCCFIPLLIIGVVIIGAFADVFKDSNISKIKFTKNQIIIAVSSLAIVIGIGSFFLYQRNENLKKAEAERKLKVDAYLKKSNDEAREKAKQSPQIICNSLWYSKETCKRIRAMTVDEIIDVANSFETKMMQFVVKDVPSVAEKCKKENIKPDACENLIKAERMNALEVIKAIQNTVPSGGKINNIQNTDSQ